MKEFGQERSMRGGLAPPVPSQEPLPGWDRRTWLIAIPLALFVIYAFIPSLNNGFVSWDDDRTSSTTPISVVWAQPR